MRPSSDTAIPYADPPVGMEHRWGRRIACGARAELVCGQDTRPPGRLRDVSMSGAFVETPVALPLYAAVEVTLWREAGGRVQRHGHVVRQEHDGVGIEWREVSPGAICPVLGCDHPCEAAASWD